MANRSRMRLCGTRIKEGSENHKYLFNNVDIHIPSDQIIDTVELYHLESYQRYLSLKYLAHKVLQKSIQVESHDSIEDALTALELYKYYQTIEDVPAFLNRLYADGRKTNFKI
eukprot:NODE_92_length_21718_cov_0.361950.p11 type:complete len:113 gc:universal NODE_92_length_21718_cov_0.361950:16678-17016(+)